MIDLHMHSIYSDGDLTPDELVTMAEKQNISTISITDHDNVLAYNHLNKNSNVEVIPGIELSASDQIGRMHILGLGINPKDKELVNKMEELRQNSIDKFLLIVEYIKKQGIIVCDKDISLLINKVGDVGRQDIAKLLIDYGYVETVQEAFDKYLIDAYNHTKKNRRDLSPAECIELINKSGGIAILAHPISLKRDNKNLERLIVQMIYYGLDGIEVYHSNHSLEQMKYYKYLVEKYKLLYSVGSDYHGIIAKPDIVMGEGRQKNLCISSCSALDYLKK